MDVGVTDCTLVSASMVVDSFSGDLLEFARFRIDDGTSFSSVTILRSKGTTPAFLNDEMRFFGDEAMLEDL